jgi:hypothetical protein
MKKISAIPQGKAMAMGLTQAVAKGPGVPFNSGSTGITTAPGTSKRMPTTMPFIPKHAMPKGAK